MPVASLTVLKFRLLEIFQPENKVHSGALSLRCELFFKLSRANTVSMAGFYFYTIFDLCDTVSACIHGLLEVLPRSHMTF